MESRNRLVDDTEALKQRGEQKGGLTSQIIIFMGPKYQNEIVVCTPT